MGDCTLSWTHAQLLHHYTHKTRDEQSLDSQSGVSRVLWELKVTITIIYDSGTWSLNAFQAA